MIKRVRVVLSMPFLAVQFVIAGIGMVMNWLSKLFGRATRGVQIHMYWPAVQAKRIVSGEPRWQVQDLLFMNIQPKTPEARALALADERVGVFTCVCGQSDCVGEVFLPKFGSIPEPIGLTSEQEAANSEPGAAVAVGSFKFAEWAKAATATEDRLKAKVRHTFGCDYQGCMNVLGTACDHKADDGMSPPPCVALFLAGHNWRKVGHEYFCPDHPEVVDQEISVARGP